MQKDAVAGMQSPRADAANGNLSPEKPAERTMSLRELKDSIEEAKVLSCDFLSLCHSFVIFLYLMRNMLA